MNFESKIHEEILQTLERRSKIDMTKLSFVTALFGAGVIGKITFNTDQIPLFGTLYIAPFVALACDCFIIREIWSLRRIGCFLQQYSSGGDLKFETYLSRKKLRNPFYRVGSAGLTAVIVSISIWLLYFQKSVYASCWAWRNEDCLWATLSIMFWAIIDVGGWCYVYFKFDRNGGNVFPLDVEKQSKIDD